MQRAVLNRATIEVADTTEVSGFDLFRKCAFTISYGHFFSLADKDEAQGTIDER